MGRPWDYPTWRRAVLQVGMWVILLATLGLAHLVSRAKVQSAAAVTVGPFSVRLPAGWKVKSNLKQDLEAQDEEGLRKLTVSVRPMRFFDTTGDYQGPKPINFKGLGRIGSFQISQQVRLSPDQPADEPIISAVVIVPAQKARLTVSLTPQDEQELREDVRLLQRVAAGITIAPVDRTPTMRPG